MLAVAFFALLSSCTSGASSQPSVSNKPPVDFAALESRLSDQITSGSLSLDNVRAVLVSVDGQTRIEHYRKGSTALHTRHVFSVTKSVLATLIGIAVADGLISSLDQKLVELLPEHRGSLSPAVADVTLRQLLTMSAGFSYNCGQGQMENLFASGADVVQFTLQHCQTAPAGEAFNYADSSAHVASAVLASALLRDNPNQAPSVLDYAREKLFDPLGVSTQPAFTETVIDYPRDIDPTMFGWLTKPQGIHGGDIGLRVTALDMLKLGELYLNEGEWQGKRIVPAEWIRQTWEPSEQYSGYGLLWWLFSWKGHAVLAAQGKDGHLIAVVPDQRMVTVISSTNWPEYPLQLDLLPPLVHTVISALEP